MQQVNLLLAQVRLEKLVHLLQDILPALEYPCGSWTVTDP
jgi:hypothetical protein